MSVTIAVVATEGVLGGKPRIEGTRVGVFQVGSLIRDHDWSRATVADELDLSADEIDAALEYYDANPEEMDVIHEDREATYRRLRQQSRATE